MPQRSTPTLVPSGHALFQIRDFYLPLALQEKEYWIERYQRCTPHTKRFIEDQLFFADRKIKHLRDQLYYLSAAKFMPLYYYQLDRSIPSSYDYIYRPSTGNYIYELRYCYIPMKRAHIAHYNWILELELDKPLEEFNLWYCFEILDCLEFHINRLKSMLKTLDYLCAA